MLVRRSEDGRSSGENSGGTVAPIARIADRFAVSSDFLANSGRLGNGIGWVPKAGPTHPPRPPNRPTHPPEHSQAGISKNSLIWDFRSCSRLAASRLRSRGTCRRCAVVKRQAELHVGGERSRSGADRSTRTLAALAPPSPAQYRSAIQLEDSYQQEATAGTGRTRHARGS